MTNTASSPMESTFYYCMNNKKKLHLFLNISFIFLVSFFLSTPHHQVHHHSTTTIKSPASAASTPPTDDHEGCTGLHSHNGWEAKCTFIASEPRCRPEGYIDYLSIFYCSCGRHPILGYTILILWLVLLFYLLGNTTANYFCSSLEGLSSVLNLSPTIAGVTLLSLGNGAPDVFSSVVSFMGTATEDVGLNSILGGAFFVSSVVTGVISICVGRSEVTVDKPSFVRDVCFFLLSLSALLVIVLVGEINIWGAMAFTSIYFVYVSFVSTTHLCRKKDVFFKMGSLLPVSTSSQENKELAVPLLMGKNDEQKKDVTCSSSSSSSTSSSSSYFGRLLWFIEMPLYLPRRLTIPDVSEERWSQPFAVISVTLAPILMSVLWNSKRGDMGCLVVYFVGGLAGILLGTAAALTTNNSTPPSKFLFPWLGGGFLMSVIWTYIIAEELVSLLVSLGDVFGISPAILGLTVLAWGNSLGDLIANVAMACNGGCDGAQVAISGCYAGPIFNTLVGLGMSLVLSTWAQYPSSHVIRGDPTLFQTLGFLIGGLMWAVVILPARGMKLDKVLGIGLLAIYLCFLSTRLAQSTGLV